MRKITRIHLATAIVASITIGGAATAFAGGDYYKGAEPNPTYVNKSRQLDGHADHMQTSGIANSTTAAAPMKHHAKVRHMPAQG